MNKYKNGEEGVVSNLDVRETGRLGLLNIMFMTVEFVVFVS
jgi:hypothetical protein